MSLNIVPGEGGSGLRTELITAMKDEGGIGRIKGVRGRNVEKKEVKGSKKEKKKRRCSVQKSRWVNRIMIINEACLCPHILRCGFSLTSHNLQVADVKTENLS